jgi:hypothetical protein
VFAAFYQYGRCAASGGCERGPGVDATGRAETPAAGIAGAAGGISQMFTGGEPW